MPRWIGAPRTLAALGSPWPWLLALLMALIGGLAYLAPWQLTLNIGGLPSTTPECYGREVWDEPYLSGFNHDPEYNGPPGTCVGSTLAYRWAFSDASVTIPGPGRAPMLATLHVASGQPETPVVASGWSLDEVPLVALPIESRARSYALLLPPQSRDIDLRIQTPPFYPPNDPRDLAFAARGLTLVPLTPTLPAWSLLGLLCAAIMLSYATMRRWSVSPRWAAALGGGLIAICAALLVMQRLVLTLIAFRLTILLLVALLISLALVPLAAGLARRIGVAASPREVRVIVGLIALAWLIRTIGLLHPYAWSSDVGLNINNLIGVTQGKIVFTEDLPSEAGGGPAPYPPAQYLMLAPLKLFPLSDRIMISAANAFADSLTILWLWLIIRAGGLGFGATGFTGALYLFALPLLRSLSTGEMANVWGQALVAPWVLAALLWRDRRIAGGMLLAVTSIALLGHFGVFLSLLALFAALGALWLIQSPRRGLQFALIIVGALLVAGLLYYSAQIDVILGRPAAPPATTTPLQRIGLQLRDLWRLDGMIAPLLSVLGIGGALLIRKRASRLSTIVLAWLLATFGSLVTLLFSQQALRWQAFGFAVIALCGGVALNELWNRRDRWSRAMVIVLLAAMCTQGLRWWIVRLMTYGH